MTAHAPHHLLATLAIACATTGSAQDGTRTPCDVKELQAAMDRYETLLRNNASWSLHMELFSYADEHGEVADKASVDLVRTGHWVHAEEMGMETYQDEHICATAEPQEKVVVLSAVSPITDLVMHQRLGLLASSAVQLTRRTTPTGSEFRLDLDPAKAVFAYVEVSYDGRGYLSRIVMQWKPSVDPSLPLPQQVAHTPRVELRATPPETPTAAQTNAARSGLVERLRRTSEGTFEAIGPWTGYHVVDTRYRP